MRPVLCAESRNAALVVCGRAAGDADARDLLDMCGLLDGDPLALPVLGFGKRTCAGCGLPMHRANDKGLCQNCYSRATDDGVPDPDPTNGHLRWQRAPLSKPARAQVETASLYRSSKSRRAAS